MVILLAVLLVPGLLQARTPAVSWEQAGVSGPEGFFSAVWNLLTNFWIGGGPSGLAKAGGVVDPSGSPPPGSSGTGSTTTTDPTDSGGVVDPSGKP